MSQSDEVSFSAGGRLIPATLCRPDAPVGPAAAILLLAGSGPTDRDWNSPLIPGKNGSAKLLAEALADRGLVVLRFDKAFSGKNSGPPLAELTLDTYLTEAQAALALLRGRAEVDPSRLFIAGHSEGSMHVTRLALVEGGAVRGVVLMAGPGRALKDVLVTQLEGNFRDGAKLPPNEVEGHMKPIREGLAAFVAGKDVDPKSLSPLPQMQALFSNMMAPPVAALGRALVSFEPAAEAAKIEVPVLVLQGGKDVQVDPTLDAQPLVAALKAAGRDVTYHLSPDANHVLKYEPLSPAELRADLVAVQTGYGAMGRDVDPDVVQAVAAWIGR
jgi:pimeloyl-ACP methyl ester carboxylesterase